MTGGEHIFIRPGTDIFFYLSFLQEVVEQNGLAKDIIDQHLEGLQEVLALAKLWPSEKTAEVTGISKEQLSKMVSTFLSSDGAALYCSTGVNMGGNGALAYWIQEVINAVTGNLDRKGGTLVGKGVMDFLKFGVKKGLLVRDDRSRIGDFGSVNDGFPGGAVGR